MNENYEALAEVVIAIKEDYSLKECFVRILKFGSSTQQVRVLILKKELESLNAPQNVLNFIRLLENEKIAQTVLTEIEK